MACVRTIDAADIRLEPSARLLLGALASLAIYTVSACTAGRVASGGARPDSPRSDEETQGSDPSDTDTSQGPDGGDLLVGDDGHDPGDGPVVPPSDATPTSADSEAPLEVGDSDGGADAEGPVASDGDDVPPGPVVAGAPGPAVKLYDTWSYFLGQSAPPAAWHDTACADCAGWPQGQAPMGFGYSGAAIAELGTVLANDPPVVTLYLRRSFPATPAGIDRARLSVWYDDGFVAYLNGVEIARRNVSAGATHTTAASARHDPRNQVAAVETFDVSSFASLLSAQNTLAVEVHNIYAGQGSLIAAARLELTDSSKPSQAIIIGHEATDLTQIPRAAIQAAVSANLTVHFAHRSHGTQLFRGAQALAGRDATYPFAVRANNEVVEVPPETSSIRLYSGNAGLGHVPTPSTTDPTYVLSADYWATAQGRDRTHATLANGQFAVSMFAFCGDFNAFGANNNQFVHQYLDAMALMEEANPNVRFVYMTHRTNSSSVDNAAANVRYNNDVIRDYCRTNNKVLYDFADIESYDPSGQFYPNAGDDCAWCTDWCAAHPDDCWPAPYPDYCAHSHMLNCQRKGYALWYLLARLSGWNP